MGGGFWMIVGIKNMGLSTPFYATAPFLLLIIKTSIEMRNVQGIKNHRS